MLRAYEIKIEKIGNMVIAAWCLSIAILSFWGVYMYMDREIPYVYDIGNSFIEPNPVHQYENRPDDMITVNWGLKNVKRICPGSVQRYFRDLTPGSANYGKIISTLDNTALSNSVEFGDKNLPRSFQIPPRLPSKVGYSAKVCWVCNPLQGFRWFELCSRTPELEFDVIRHN